MQESGLKIILNSQTLQGAVSLRHRDCRVEFVKVENSLLHLENRYLELKKSGQIISFKIDRERLEKAWKIIGSADFAWREREFIVDFAQGFPAFYGVAVQPAKEPEAIASLTLRTSEKQIQTWNFSWLKKYIDLKVGEFRQDLAVSEGQIAYALFRFLRGEPVNNMQLFAAREMGKEDRPGYLDIFSFPNSQALYLAIQDPLSLLDRLGPEEISKKIRAAVDHVSDQNQCSYVVLEAAIIDALRDKSRSLSVVGLDPTLNLLVAVPEAEKIKATGTEGQPTVNAVSANQAAPVVRKELVYDGSITRNMGFMQFDGDAVINGSIETEAQISVTGNLRVTGQIKGAQVRCFGNLVVEGGINMGDTGKVYVSGNLKVAFIESAKILCQGYMEVGKSILNSHLYVGHNLMLADPDSMIVGGVISCRGVVKVMHLGLRLGNKTILRLGVDWRVDHRLAGYQARATIIEGYMLRTRNEMRELISGQKGKRDDDAEAKKLKLQRNLQRCRALLDKISAKRIAAKSNYTYHYQSQAIILGRIDQNCEISICDKAVSLNSSESGVVIRITDRGQPTVAAA